MTKKRKILVAQKTGGYDRIRGGKKEHVKAHTRVIDIPEISEDLKSRIKNESLTLDTQNTTFRLKGKQGFYKIYKIRTKMENTWTKEGFKKLKTYHCLISTPDGQIEDLSYNVENIDQLKKKVRKYIREYETYR